MCVCIHTFMTYIHFWVTYYSIQKSTYVNYFVDFHIGKGHSLSKLGCEYYARINRKSINL